MNIRIHSITVPFINKIYLRIIFVGNRNGIRTDIKIIYLIIYYYMYEGSIQYIYDMIL